MNSTKWTQRAVKRKAFEHIAKSMVRESAIGVVEIARCLLSKQAKSAGPQRTTLPCFFVAVLMMVDNCFFEVPPLLILNLCILVEPAENRIAPAGFFWRRIATVGLKTLEILSLYLKHSSENSESHINQPNHRPGIPYVGEQQEKLEGQLPLQSFVLWTDRERYWGRDS